MKSIDFYYDYGSPTAYLAWTQLIKLNNDHYKISYFPVLLGGIFKATDNKPPGLVASKAKWMLNDVKMYADKYSVNFQMNESFPVNTLYLMRGAIYALKNNFIEKYNEIMFNAMWVSNINLSKPDNIIKVLENSGLNSKELLSATENQEIKDELKNATSNSVGLGLFGVPSFIVNNKLFFGQDRMNWFID